MHVFGNWAKKCNKCIELEGGRVEKMNQQRFIENCQLRRYSLFLPISDIPLVAEHC